MKVLSTATVLLVGALVVGGFNALSLLVVILVAVAVGGAVRRAS